MTEFSERLKQTRESVGWSKTKLAQHIGVSLSTYANWEYGIAEPDIETIKAICRALGVSADTLLNLTVKPKVEEIDLKNDPVVLSYGGNPVSDEDMEVIRAILKRHKEENE
jgi:transcriptional regulator with XRE-family HTH domain